MQQQITYYSQYQRSSLTALMMMAGVATNAQPMSPTSNISLLNQNTFQIEATVIPFKRNNEDNLEFDTSIKCDIDTIANFNDNEDELIENLLTPSTLSNNLLVNISETSYINKLEDLSSVSDNTYLNYLKLDKYFDSELSLKKDFVKSNIQAITTNFHSVALRLSDLPFEQSAIEILKNGTLKFTFTFDENKSLRVTKNLNVDTHFENEILYSYFENRELVSANANNLDEFVEGFREYIVA